MTREEYINKVLEQYRLVKVLAEKNGCKALQLRHKTQERDMVLHSFPKVLSVYETLCHVRHENLPEIYDSVILEDGQIVLEEFINGITVAEVLETGLYKPSGAKKILLSVCNALDYLHSQGIIHRDIKPENIIVSENGRIVLIDFNISRIQKPNGKDTEVMGTVGYASPEQMGMAQSDERTDIYAMGVLMNVMLTGMHPCESIPKGLFGRIIKKCTNINPDLRYQDVCDFKKALSLLLIFK